MALTYTPAAELGQKCFDFALPATDGKTYQNSDFAKSRVLVLMFICNHCPYVKAVEDRLIALGRDYNRDDVQLVGINANDAENYPEDSFEKMRERAVAKNYPFPYLYDESQEVARRFGAVCTPDFFVYDQDRRLAYRGRLDDSWKEPAQVHSQELKAAIDSLLAGRKPTPEQKPSMGCNIKWRNA